MYYAVSTIWNIIRTLLVVGVIIFVHELGHFLAAKRLGIKVDRFSIGFGPRLLGLKRGDTEYRISWFPIFGGYVKMAGENPAEERDEEEEGLFRSAPVSHRAVVALSGPGMNMILGVVAFALAYMVGLPPDLGTTIGYVEPDTPASKAGIVTNDKILSIDGYKVRTWDDVRENVSIKPGEEIKVDLLRGRSEEISLRVVPERFEGFIHSVNLKPQIYLDDGTIPEELRREFGSYDILLSQDATVSVEEQGSKWLVTDKDSRYSIRKERNRVDIYPGKDPEKTDLIFSVDLDLPGELDKSTIPEYLRQRLENNGTSFSSDATVVVEEPGSKWAIVDKGRRYPIAKENNSLDIYREMEIGKIGVYPVIKPIIGEVEPGSAGAKAGFRSGDLVEAINGKEIGHIIELFNEIQDSPTKEATLTVSRAEDAVENILLEFHKDGQPVSFEGVSWLSSGKPVSLGPITAFRKAVFGTVRMVWKVFQFLKRLIIREVSAKYVAGPVGIVQLTMSVVKTGMAGVLRLAGFLSVNLGVVNMLPLFITDGALIVFLVIEKLRGKPLERKRQIFIQQLGVGFIIFLFIALTYNDILRWIRGPF
jgi:regulator of sigma E protease